MDERETGEYIQDLLDITLIFYFNDCTPSKVLGFKSWANTEFEIKYSLDIEQIKYLGRNFLLVKFCRPLHRKKAILEGPWVMDKYLHAPFYGTPYSTSKQNFSTKHLS
jgi:hypothetical protein